MVAGMQSDRFVARHRSSVLGPPQSDGSDPADKPGGQPNGHFNGHPAAALHPPGLELSPAMAAVALVSSVGQNDVLGGSPATGESWAESHGPHTL